MKYILNKLILEYYEINDKIVFESFVLMEKINNGGIIMKYKYKYKSGSKNFLELENEIEVPNFQRRLVWSEKEKKAFITTLHKGYPFGSILIYQYDEDKANKKYTLIDGLQRYTTILDFKKFPDKYIKEDILDKYVEKIIEFIEIENSNSIFNRAIKLIESSISSLTLQNNPKPHELYNLLNEKTKELNIDVSPEKDNIVELQGELLNSVKNYLDINTISIPAIEFTGDESELADVFENLNRGGKKLTKYQVFAAQWSKFNIQLSDNNYSKKILDKVVERYDNLNESRDVEITGYDENKLKISKEINLAEFCYAVGEIILEKMPVFWKTKQEDLANIVGYSTIAIVMNISVKEVHKIVYEKEFFKNTELLDNTVEKIIPIYQEINNYFEKFLKHPGDSEKYTYESNISTTHQLLSYFATLWTIKYKELNEKNEYKIKDITCQNRYKKNYDNAKKNFIKYYLNDLFSGYWSGSGDTKVQRVREGKGQRYLNPIEKKNLENTLISWYEEKQQLVSLNFDGFSKTLLTIQASHERIKYKESNYEFEHIFSKECLKNEYKSKRISGGSLGNLMFLEKSYNRSKRELTLYESEKEGQKIDEKFIAQRFYPTRKDCEEVKKELLNSKSELKELKKILDKRGKAIINNLLNYLYEN